MNYLPSWTSRESANQLYTSTVNLAGKGLNTLGGVCKYSAVWMITHPLVTFAAANALLVVAADKVSNIALNRLFGNDVVETSPKLKYGSSSVVVLCSAAGVNYLLLGALGLSLTTLPMVAIGFGLVLGISGVAVIKKLTYNRSTIPQAELNLINKNLYKKIEELKLKQESLAADQNKLIRYIDEFKEVMSILKNDDPDGVDESEVPAEEKFTNSLEGDESDTKDKISRFEKFILQMPSTRFEKFVSEILKNETYANLGTRLHEPLTLLKDVANTRKSVADLKDTIVILEEQKRVKKLLMFSPYR